MSGAKVGTIPAAAKLRRMMPATIIGVRAGDLLTVVQAAEHADPCDWTDTPIARRAHRLEERLAEVEAALFEGGQDDTSRAGKARGILAEGRA